MADANEVKLLRTQIRGINATLRLYQARGYENFEKTLINKMQSLGLQPTINAKGHYYFSEKTSELSKIKGSLINSITTIKKESTLSSIKNRYIELGELSRGSSSDQLDAKIKQSQRVTNFLKDYKYAIYAMEAEGNQHAKDILDDMEHSEGYLDLDSVEEKINTLLKDDKEMLDNIEVMFERKKPRK